MKNLKINKKFVSLLTAGAISLTLVGCTRNNDDDRTEETIDDSSIYQLYEGRLENDITDNIVADNGLHNVAELSVVSRKNKEPLDITKIQVLVNDNGVNSLKNINRDLTLFLSSEITAIYYEGKEISLNDYMIVDANGKEISEIKQLFVDSKEEELPLNNNNNNEDDKITTITLEAVDETITLYTCKLTNRNVQYDPTDVLKTLILVNLSSLSNEVNSQVYNTLLIRAGNPDVNELVMGYTRLINAFNNPYYGQNEGSNYKFFYDDNVPFEQLTHLGDLILDRKQKEIYNDINNRLNRMSTMLDTYELDAEVVNLLKEIQKGINGEEKYSLIDNSTILALSPRFDDARGMIFMVCTQDDRCLTEESQKAVQKIAPYTREENEFSLYGYDLFAGIAKTFEGESTSRTLTK